MLKAERISNETNEHLRSVCVTGRRIGRSKSDISHGREVPLPVERKDGTLSIWRRAQVQELRDLPAAISGLGLLHPKRDGIFLHEGMLLSGAATIHSCDER